MIGVYFRNLLELTVSAKSIAKYIPNEVEWWGKMHFKNDGECIQSHWAHELVKEMNQDASFARVSLSNSPFNCKLTHQ